MSAYYVLDIVLSTVEEIFDLIFVSLMVEDLRFSSMLLVKMESDSKLGSKPHSYFTS